MAETMYAAPGVGLAATQVDVHKRIIVIDVSETRDDLRVFVNPEIVAAEGEAECEEGCLSVPGYYDKVTRAARVTVARTTSAASRSSSTADGLLAVCIQHEMDHLLGQDLRRLPVAAEARAARRAGCARSSGSRADAALERPPRPHRHAGRLCRHAGLRRARLLAAIARRRHSPVPLVLTQPDRPRGRGLTVAPSPVKALALERAIPVLPAGRRCDR